MTRKIKQLTNNVLIIVQHHDLAEIYGYAVKRLNESGDRRGTNIKKLPFAFTEQPILMT
jgi:hypothetical protein